MTTYSHQKTILHIEDGSEDRQLLEQDILQIDKNVSNEYPYRVTHLNPVEEPIDCHEAVRRIKKEGSDSFDFIVVDLGMNQQQSEDLKRWFEQKSIPENLPSEMDSGLNIVNALIKEFHFPAKQIAIFTQFAPDYVNRELAFVSKLWFGIEVLTYYKSDVTESEDLKTRIMEVLGLSSNSIIQLPQDGNNEKPEEQLYSVICLSDKYVVRKRIEKAIENNGQLYNAKLEKVITKDIKEFKTSIQDKYFDVVIIDITSGDNDENLLDTIIQEGHYDRLMELSAVELLLDQNPSKNPDGKKTWNIAITDSHEKPTPELFRWFSKNGVDWVIDKENFEMNVFGTLWNFINRTN